MGKGDPKTKRGKIFKGSFGKHRLARKPKEEVIVVKKKEKVVEEVIEKEGFGVR